MSFYNIRSVGSDFITIFGSVNQIQGTQERSIWVVTLEWGEAWTRLRSSRAVWHPFPLRPFPLEGFYIMWGLGGGNIVSRWGSATWVPPPLQAFKPTVLGAGGDPDGLQTKEGCTPACVWDMILFTTPLVLGLQPTLKSVTPDILPITDVFLSKKARISFWGFFVCLFFFLRPHLWHMEVPGARAQIRAAAEVYATAMAAPDPSCICKLCCSLRQQLIFNPLREIGDWNLILMETISGS